MRTGVILPVPAIEHVVGEHRSALDAHAAAGVPAHLTVLYPFVPSDALDEAVIDRLAAVVAATATFTCRFARCAWFGEEVLWLAPEPPGPVEALTAAVWAAFPDHPPYAGDHPTVVAHLTVGAAPLADLESLRTAERVVSARLPVTAVIDHALLVAESEDGSWHPVARLPLGRPTALGA